MRTIFALLSAFVLLFLTPCSPASAHWPDQPPHQFAHLGQFQFEGGGTIQNLRISYVTHGNLNAARNNAILFMPGFGLNHHQLDHLIGPGRPLDTEKYFVICVDNLGATQTTFEHSTSATNSGLKMSFPFFNARDVVTANHRLVTEKLGIARLLAASGVSSGADYTVQLAVSYPDFVRGIFPIEGGGLWGTQGFFFVPLVLAIIESCAGWNDGNYDANPKACATNALSVLIPYFYTRDWWDQYVDTPEAYSKWRNHWGDYYLDIQDARDLFYLQKSVTLGWLGNTPGFNGDIHAALASVQAKALFIYNTRDQFYLPHHMEDTVKAVPNARGVAIDSIAGHLMCCNADPQATWIMGEAIRKFLQELSAE
jgi:homoserine O-acetyltransferase